MRRPPPPRPLRYLAAAATDMSSRPPYRGGRNQWQRGFSNRPYSAGGRGQQYVTGDSHFRSVQDANLGFRQGDTGSFPNQTGYHPPPPRFGQNHQFRRPSPPFDQNQAYRPTQQFRPHQQFQQPQQFQPPQQFQRPQEFRPPQQFRPRPPKPLDYRNWEFAKTTPPPTCERFVVLSYNILADYLANDHRGKLYYHIPHHMMEWQWRKGNLIFELGLWSPDIMCFQEVDRFQEIEEELKIRGYRGIWKMRTGNPVDGCAIFWRSSRFKLLYEECIEFNKLGLRDNVAQICVLESISQNCTKNTAALPTSSSGSNKVVICNIHVLYNPKRGEIKLGQVRVLLDRAHAVSKIWNDAPIVLCGDFNCTPKSPLYNFISEQKLDISGVDRDKVSGQALAQIYPPRSFNPNYRAQPANNLVQDPPMVDGREAGMKLNDSPLDMLNPKNPESTVENVPLGNNLSQPQCTNTLDVFDKSCTNVNVEVNKETEKNSVNVSKVDSGSAFHVPSDGLKEDASTSYCEGGFPVDNLSDETHRCSSSVSSRPEQVNSDVTGMGYKEKVDFTSNSDHGSEQVDVSKIETGSALHTPGHGLKEDASTSYSDGGFPVDNLSDETHRCSSTVSSHPEKVYSDVTEMGDKEKVDFTSNLDHGLSSGHCHSNVFVEQESMNCNIPKPPSTTDSDSTREGMDPGYVDPFNSEIPLSNVSGQTSIADASDLEGQENLENLALIELDQAMPEDDITFLSALHNTEDAFFPPNSMLPASTNSDLSPGLDSETVGVWKTTYDPSLWTPMEIEAATGNVECTLLEHPLKLRSTYTEVEDCTGTRDSNGEPLVTSYNRLFLGTVDYIWHSEGLQTVRVLAPIPKHAMQWTSGFPTKKWGSDHIALASELAFTNSFDQSQV